MKLYQLKTRLTFSLVVGLIGFTLTLIYMLIAKEDFFYAAGISNLIEVFYKIMRLIESFLLFFALSLIITSLLAVIKKQKVQRIFISLTLGVAIVLILAIPEIIIRQKIALNNKINDKNLGTVEVVGLYEKAIRKGYIKSLSNIAVHPNLPDSIQRILAGSEYMEVRRSIAWKTDSERILKKLSIDSEWEVRNAVATNKYTPFSTLNKLRNDTNEYVRNTSIAMIQNRD